MVNAGRAIETLGQVKAKGINSSIDAFGTGYSSLSYLKRFPIDTLKIDRSFLDHVATDSDDAAIVAAIIALARSLKLRLVAEGVETESQVEFLTRSGCDFAQGLLFAPPVAPEEARMLFDQCERHQSPSPRATKEVKDTDKVLLR